MIKVKVSFLNEYMWMNADCEVDIDFTAVPNKGDLIYFTDKQMNEIEDKYDAYFKNNQELLKHKENKICDVPAVVKKKIFNNDTKTIHLLI